MTPVTSANEIIAKAAHAWARRPSAKRSQHASISPATYNQRLSILSSFYHFVCTQKRNIGRFFTQNPINLIIRAPLQDRTALPSLDQEKMMEQLACIDKNTDLGKRDYALLCVLLTTNCRACDLARLRYRHFDWDRRAIIWEGRNGSRQASTKLAPVAADALKTYLYALYEDADDDIPWGDMPIWVSFSQRNHYQAIGTQTIVDICQTHLEVSSVGAARRLFLLKGAKGSAADQPSPLLWRVR